MYKIGITKNIKQRVRSLQNGGGVKLDVVFLSELLENPYKIECKLHHKLKHLMKYNEWFDLTQKQVRATISDIKEAEDHFKEESSLRENCKTDTIQKKTVEESFGEWKIPKTYEETLLGIGRLATVNEQLQLKIEEDRSKVEAYDYFTSNTKVAHPSMKIKENNNEGTN